MLDEDLGVSNNEQADDVIMQNVTACTDYNPKQGVESSSNAVGGEPVRLESTVPYSLNRQKALLKKAAACDREPIQFLLKDCGRQSVIVCNTGTYELTREVFNHYYSHVSTKFGIKEVTDIFDRERAKVGDKLKIYNRNAKREVGRMSKFTINQFHTTCRLHINGSHHSAFIEQDLPEIVNILRRKLPAATRLNEKFRILLDKYNIEKSRPSKSPRQRKDIMISATTGRSSSNISLNSSCIGKNNDLDTYSCPFCTDADLSDMIECCECGSWIHFSCAGLDSKKRRDHYAKFDVIYRCSMCISAEDEDTPAQTTKIESTFDIVDTGVAPESRQVHSSPVEDLVLHSVEEPPCKETIQANLEQCSGDNLVQSAPTSKELRAGARRKDNAAPVIEIPVQANPPSMTSREQSLESNKVNTGIAASTTAGMDVQSIGNMIQPPISATATEQTASLAAMATDNFAPPKCRGRKKGSGNKKTRETVEILSDNDESGLGALVDKLEKENKVLRDKHQVSQKRIKMLEGKVAEIEQSNRLLRTQAASTINTEIRSHQPATPPPSQQYLQSAYPQQNLQPCLNAAEIVVLKHRLNFIEQRIWSSIPTMFGNNPIMQPWCPPSWVPHHNVNNIPPQGGPANQPWNGIQPMYSTPVHTGNVNGPSRTETGSGVHMKFEQPKPQREHGSSAQTRGQQSQSCDMQHVMNGLGRAGAGVGEELHVQPATSATCCIPAKPSVGGGENLHVKTATNATCCIPAKPSVDGGVDLHVQTTTNATCSIPDKPSSGVIMGNKQPSRSDMSIDDHRVFKQTQVESGELNPPNEDQHIVMQMCQGTLKRPREKIGVYDDLYRDGAQHVELQHLDSHGGERLLSSDSRPKPGGRGRQNATENYPEGDDSSQACRQNQQSTHKQGRTSLYSDSTASAPTSKPFLGNGRATAAVHTEREAATL